MLAAAWMDTQAHRVVTGQPKMGGQRTKSKPLGVLWTVDATCNRFRIAARPANFTPQSLAFICPL
jgi:hypothetical protein